PKTASRTVPQLNFQAYGRHRAWSSKSAPIISPSLVHCAHLEHGAIHDPPQVPHKRRCRCVRLGAARRRRPLRKETAMTSTMTPLDTPRETVTDTIRPFQFHASDEDLADLRQRIKATRWPEKEPVADFSQGVPLA